jgi:hypothetical protein
MGSDANPLKGALFNCDVLIGLQLLDHQVLGFF